MIQIAQFKMTFVKNKKFLSMISLFWLNRKFSVRMSRLFLKILFQTIDFNMEIFYSRNSKIPKNSLTNGYVTNGLLKKTINLSRMNLQKINGQFFITYIIYLGLIIFLVSSKFHVLHRACYFKLWKEKQRKKRVKKPFFIYLSTKNLTKNYS